MVINNQMELNRGLNYYLGILFLGVFRVNLNTKKQICIFFSN